MVFFIVNPRAGQGMGLRLWEKMKEEGKSLLGEEGFSVFFTEKQGEKSPEKILKKSQKSFMESIPEKGTEKQKLSL